MGKVKEYASTAQFVTIWYTTIFLLIAVVMAIFIVGVSRGNFGISCTQFLFLQCL